MRSSVESRNAPKRVALPAWRASCPSRMSHSPAAAASAAAIRNRPVANSSAAARLSAKPSAVTWLALSLAAALEAQREAERGDVVGAYPDREQRAHERIERAMGELPEGGLVEIGRASCRERV